MSGFRSRGSSARFSKLELGVLVIAIFVALLMVSMGYSNGLPY